MVAADDIDALAGCRTCGSWSKAGRLCRSKASPISSTQAGICATILSCFGFAMCAAIRACAPASGDRSSVPERAQAPRPPSGGRKRWRACGQRAVRVPRKPVAVVARSSQARADKQTSGFWRGYCRCALDVPELRTESGFRPRLLACHVDTAARWPPAPSPLRLHADLSASRRAQRFCRAHAGLSRR